MATDDEPIRPGLEPEARVSARRLLERTGEHLVISVYLDLERDEFATAPARATEVRSLIDAAHRESIDEESLSHQARAALKSDLERIDDYLQGDDVPVSGSGALAIFCSGADDLFEVIRLAQPVDSRAVIDSTPYIEPLVAGHDPGRWCVALVNSRAAKIFEGYVVYLSEREEVDDDVRGQQSTHQASYEDDVDRHLRGVADDLYRRWQRDAYATLVLGGPVEIVPRLQEMLHNDLRPALSTARIDLDVATATDTEVRDAARGLLTEMQTETQRADLEALAGHLGAGGPGAAGLEATLEALVEQRVQTLLLSRGFAASGGRCPQDGLLTTSGEGNCPGDGTPLVPVADLREAAVQAAILQDAEVIVLDDPPPGPEPDGGIGALLRF